MRQGGHHVGHSPHSGIVQSYRLRFKRTVFGPTRVWLSAKHVVHKHVVCECEGELVCIYATTTAVVQNKTGLTTCGVLATNIRQWNVNTVAGAIMTVTSITTTTTVKCRSSVVQVSAASKRFFYTSTYYSSFFSTNMKMRKIVMKLYVDLDVSEHTRIGQCCNDDDKISSELAKCGTPTPQFLTNITKICIF